ncbi:MAG: hypothetical protein AAFU71_17590 [Cyanobacteria bacterium J06632_22]
MVQWIIFEGMHAPALTTAFLAAVATAHPNLKTAPRHQPDVWLNMWPTVVAPKRIWPYPNGQAIQQHRPQLASNSAALGVIAFSAGVVAAVEHLRQWQQTGGQVAGLVALDGWGVPLNHDYPTFRLSHDQFTHRSSLLLGSGPVNFYADPAVPHLTLWEAPQTVTGWQVDTHRGHIVQASSALEFLTQAIDQIEARHGQEQ